MEEKVKLVYESPLMTIIEVREEGMLCVSPLTIIAYPYPTFNGFKEEEEW